MSAPPLYLLAETIMCAFASAAIFALWKRGGRQEQRIPPDEAFPWFAAAVGWWAINGLWTLLLPAALPDATKYFFRLIGSPVNTAFFLFALGYFEYGWEIFIGPRRRDWNRWVIIAVSVDIVLLVALNQMGVTYAWPDVILSTATLVLIGISFYRTFRARDFHALAYVALMSVVLVLLAQLFEIPPLISRVTETWHYGVSLASKAAFITMFLALAYTWAVSLPLPAPLVREPEELYLRFLAEPSGSGYRPHQVLFGPKSAPTKVPMSTVLFGRLLLLAVDRKQKGANSKVHIGVDLETDAQGMRRIGVQLHYPWADLHDSPDLGYHRLKILPENIEFDDLDPPFREIVAKLNFAPKGRPPKGGSASARSKA